MLQRKRFHFAKESIQNILVLNKVQPAETDRILVLPFVGFRVQDGRHTADHDPGHAGKEAFALAEPNVRYSSPSSGGTQYALSRYSR